MMKKADYNPYSKPLIGQSLQSVECKGGSWFFKFSDEISVVTESHWRLLSADRIVVTSQDHGHKFGLPAPVDAAPAALAGVSKKLVVDASITPPTADLIVDFGDHVHLQFLQMSSGYESWRLYVRGSETICMGGGTIEHFKAPA
jgi:hypothetical protein